MSSNYSAAAEVSVLKVRNGLSWITQDIRNVQLSELFARYITMELSILDIYGKPFTLNPYLYETELRSADMTLDEWFESIGDRALTLTNNLPSLKLSTANYIPATYHMGSYQLAGENAHPSHERAIEDYRDIVVTLDKIDTQLLYDYGLWSVGGFTLKTNLHSYGMRINNGGDIIRKSSELTFGFMNFEKIGKLSYIPITTSMVTKVDSNKSFHERVIINTKQSLSGKSVGIVIGGYLHLLDDFISITGDTSIMLTMSQLNIVERILESKDFLDLDFMMLDDIDNSAIVGQVLSDANILKYLTCEYTFLVLIDNVDVVRRTSSVEELSTMHRYLVSDDIPVLGRLYNELGRGMEYWPKYECGRWSLNVCTSYVPQYAFDQTMWKNNVRINDALHGVMPNKKTYARMEWFEARV